MMRAIQSLFEYFVLGHTTAAATATVRSLSAAKVEEDSFANEISRLLNISRAAALSGGIFLTVVGSCVMAVGSVLMKLGILAEARRHGRVTGTHPYCQPQWWTGMLLYSLGALLHILALIFAPASVLAPMNSLGLVANAIVAATVLHEPFGFTEAFGTFGTIVGVTLCAVASFLPHDETQIVSGLDSWKDPWYLVYVGVCAVMTLGSLIHVNNEESKIIEKRWDKFFSRHVERGHIELAELSPRMSNTGRGAQTGNLLKVSTHTRTPEDSSDQNTRLLSHSSKGGVEGSAALPQYPAHIGMLYGFLAGLVGAQCVLELKEFCSCLKFAWTNRSVWAAPQPYISSVLCCIAIFLQIHFLNFGLGRGEATLIIPTYYVFWTAFGTLGGFAKFHEMAGFGPGQITIFSVGLATTLLCIGFMAVQEMEHMRTRVDNAVPVLTGVELETDEIRSERLRQLHTGVPLALGFTILPAGHLSGRLRTDKALSQVPLRRTRSFQEVAVGSIFPEVSEGQPTGKPGTYHWTLAGTAVPHGVQEQMRETRRHRQQYQQQTSGHHTRRSSSFRDAPSRENVPSRPVAAARRGPSGPRVGVAPRPQRHRGLHDIVFEETPNHQSAPPDFLKDAEMAHAEFHLWNLWGKLRQWINSPHECHQIVEDEFYPHP